MMMPSAAHMKASHSACFTLPIGRFASLAYVTRLAYSYPEIFPSRITNLEDVHVLVGGAVLRDVVSLQFRKHGASICADEYLGSSILICLRRSKTWPWYLVTASLPS